MLTIGEAANNYELIMRIALKPKFYFHTTDNKNYKNSDVTTTKFFELINSVDFIDEKAERYNKIYINPFLKMCLLVSACSNADDPIKFQKLPYTVIQTIYDQLKASVTHGYRIGLDVVRSNIQQMRKTEQNLID